MSHILISAAHKSSGKTTITIGLAAALSQRNHKVQTFKKGPDYIDPMWLSKATGNNCQNLDFYTMQRQEILSTFSRFMQGMDIGLIEGNKGLYDGLDLDGSNSNAALAKLLDSPVVLVIDARGMTRGIAPLILGYQDFDPDINIAGVILNQVGGSRHEGKLRNILEHYTDAKVLGAVHRDKELEIDERHLGLIPSNESTQTDRRIEAIANAVSEGVDLEKLIELSGETKLDSSSSQAREAILPKPDIRIGIAQDPAFGFYYNGDLEALKVAGAELVPFNTIEDKQLPKVDALFIGGGFPETHLDLLQANTTLRNEIKDAIESGMPAYAECGGLMYLSRSIKWKDKSSQMVGVIQGDIVMEDKPQGRGYVQLSENGNGLWPLALDNSSPSIINGHEFHYSRLEKLDTDLNYAFDVKRGYGIDGKSDGLIYKNLQANYSHLRDVTNNHWAQRFTDFIRNVINTC